MEFAPFRDGRGWAGLLRRAAAFPFDALRRRPSLPAVEPTPTPRELVDPAAIVVLRALDGGVVDEADLEHVADRWWRVHRGDVSKRPLIGVLSAHSLADRERALEALFLAAFGRLPDEVSRRRMLARWQLGLDDAQSLERELVATSEFATLERFRTAARALLAELRALDGVDIAPTDDADLHELFILWRLHWNGPAPDGWFPRPLAREALADRASAFDSAFRRVLMRPPDSATRRRMVAIGWLLDESDEASCERLRLGDEYTEIVAPLVARIDAAYRRFCHRPPSSSEVQDAVDRARTALRTRAELVTALRDGTVDRKLGIRPLKLELDVTSQCNLRCTMCYFSDPKYGSRKRVDVSVEDFRRFASEVLPFCGLMSLSFGTEPLLHPRFVELLEIVAAEEVPWRYAITNGLLLDARLIAALVRIPLHGFSISIDAATPSTYERIRRGARWSRLIANIHELQQAKRRAGSEYPRLNFNFVILRSNFEELPALVRLAHELGVEGVSATHVTPFSGLALESERVDTEPQRVNQILAATRAEAERLSVRVALPEPFRIGAVASAPLKDTAPVAFLFPEAPRPELPCPFPWQFVGVDPYGNVVPCGWWYRDPPLGNVRTQSFLEIWEGEAWTALREEHRTGRLRRACLECPASGMGSCDGPRAFAPVELG